MMSDIEKLAIDTIRTLSIDAVQAANSGRPGTPMALAPGGVWARYLFEKQSKEYRDAVLPPSVTARVAVERAATFGWDRYCGFAGRIIGMRTFGASAPLEELPKKFGFTADASAATARELSARLTLDCSGRRSSPATYAAACNFQETS